MKKITIKEGIEMGLITKQELTKKATEFKLEEVNHLYSRHVIRVFEDELRELGFPAIGTFFYSPERLTLKVSSAAELHETRKLLRKLFGRWEDEILYIRPYEFTVDVVYEGKGDLPVPTRIEVWYPRDELPPGILKEGCHIEERSYTNYSIVCE